MRPFDPTGAFDPVSEDRGEVVERAVRGAGVTLASGGLGVAVQVIGTVVLARLLAPAEFGVVTMVTTFSLLLVNFGLNGFTEAIVQRDKVDDALVSNLFWINLAVGLCLTIAFAVAGSVLSRFYRDARVASVALGISATIILTSTSVMHLALLKRAMRFTLLSAVDIISRTASMVVSIVLARAGWGHWALVTGAVTSPLSTSIGVWSLCRWTPSLPRRAPGTASMVRFALNTYGRFGINFVTRNLDNVLVGWRFGAHSLGLYKKAYDLFAFSANALISPITIVAVSALSRANRDSGEFKRQLLGSLTVIGFVGMGLGGALTLVGKDLIFLLLGPGWEESGRIFTCFGMGIGVMMLYCTHGWIHLSIGRPDRWLRWACIEVSVTAALFVLGLRWGPAGVAAAWTVAFWILIIPAFSYAGKPIGLTLRPILAVSAKCLLASVLAGTATLGIVRGIPSLALIHGLLAPAARILTTWVVFGILYLALVLLFHRSFTPALMLGRLLRDMFQQRTAQVGPEAAVATPHGMPAPVGKAPGPLGHAPRAVEPSSGPDADSTPIVSILIPVHNAQDWIADTIRSAAGQTWARKEIILVDDGSTDRTLTIAKQFQSDSIHIVTQPKQGAAAARNLAFSLSHGDYIQWLDADDLLHPAKIALQMEVAGEDPSKRVLLSSAFGRFMYRHYRADFTPTALWTDLSPVEWLLRKMEHNVFMQTATWLVSRELTEAAGPWDTRLLSDDDGEYFCRVLKACDAVRFVPDAKVYFRTPWFTSLGYIGQSDAKLDAHWLSMQLHIDYLRSFEDTPRARAACLAYLQNNFAYFYLKRSDVVHEMEKVARTLGGQLKSPQLPWKYVGIEAIFGWKAARYLQCLLPQLRWLLRRRWDKAVYAIESRGNRPVLGASNEGASTSRGVAGQLLFEAQEQEAAETGANCVHDAYVSKSNDKR